MFSSNVNQKNVSYRSLQNKSATPVPYDEEQYLKSVIKRHDTDGDGVLSLKELKEAFKAAGSSVPGWRAIRALCHADSNRDGFIGEKELANLIQYANKRGYVL